MTCTLQKQCLGTAEVNSPAGSEYFGQHWLVGLPRPVGAGRLNNSGFAQCCLHPIASPRSSACSRVTERNEPGPDDLWHLRRTAVPSSRLVTWRSRGRAARALCFPLCCSSVVPAPRLVTQRKPGCQSQQCPMLHNRFQHLGAGEGLTGKLGIPYRLYRATPLCV